MDSNGKKQNITSFNGYSNKAHIVSDLRRNSGYGYYDGTSALDYEEDNNLDNNVIDFNARQNDLNKPENSVADNSYDGADDNNSKSSDNSKDANGNTALKNGLNLFGKKKISLKTKLIICAVGGGAALIFIMFLTLLTSNNGANLDIVNNSNSAQMSSGSNSNGSFSSGGSVEGGTTGNNLLTVSLISAIGSENYNKLNSEILSIAKSSCNKETVAEVASTLVKGVGEYGYRIPYYWGGGHSGTTYMGVDGNLGSPTAESYSGDYYYYNVGYDCSGFVSWAVGNVLCRNFSMTTYGFLDISTPISWAEAGAGDILVSTGHIVLILQNNGDYFTTVESAGKIGLIFSTYDQAKINAYGMQIKSMSNYFASNC